MKTKTLFILLYGIGLTMAVAMLSDLITPMISINNSRVVIAMTVLSALCLFLALFNYEPSRTPRQLEVALMKRVENSWLQALTDLEKSFHRTSPPTLTLEYTESNHKRSVIEANDTAATAAIVAAFTNSGRSLLITGDSKSGKTASLLRLARVLIERAKDDPSQSIPVVLNLSSLTDGNFEQWLISELRTRYDVPEELCRHWLLQNRLILLLDGVDDEQKAGAIDNFMKENEAPGIAVSGYNAGAIGLKGTATLTAARPTEPKYIKNGEVFDSVEAFAAERFRRAESLKPAYTRNQVQKWLRWLATELKAQGQTEFTIFQIQPAWLRSEKLKWFYLALSRVVGAGVVMLLGTGLFFLTQAVLKQVSHSGVRGILDAEKDLGCWLLVTILIGGLTTAALDWRVDKRSQAPKAPDLLTNLKDMALYLVVSAVVFFGSSFLYLNLNVILSREHDPFQFMKPLVGAIMFGVCFGLVFWFRSRQHNLRSDTNMSDRLVWSRPQVLAGLLRLGLPGGWVAGLIISWRSQPVPRIGSVAVVLLAGIAVGSLVLLLSPGVSKLKVIQNSLGGPVQLKDIVTPNVLSAILWLGVILGTAVLVAMGVSSGSNPGYHIMILLTVIGGMVGGIAGGLRRVSVVEKTTSSHDAGLAIRNALLIWLSVSMPAVLFLWIYGGLVMKTDEVLGTGFFFGLGLGMLFSFAYIGFDIVFRIVFRFILWVNGAAPLTDWVASLDYAASLGFLRKVGEAYVFDQAQLQKFFIDQKEPKLTSEKLERLLHWRHKADPSEGANCTTVTS